MTKGHDPSGLQPEISSTEEVSSSTVVVYDMRELHLRLKDCEHPAREIRKESLDHRRVGKGKMASSSSSSSSAAAAAAAKDHTDTYRSEAGTVCVTASMSMSMSMFMHGGVRVREVVCVTALH